MQYFQTEKCALWKGHAQNIYGDQKVCYGLLKWDMMRITK